MRVTLWLCGALAAIALAAGCGGGDSGGGDGTAGATAAGTASADAATAVLEAYERLRTDSYRATVEQTISFDAGDAPQQVEDALSAAAGTTTSEVEAELGGSRVRAVVDAPQIPRGFTVVLYDGETFFAAGDDDRFTELGGSIGGLFADLADIGSEELGRALEDVRDEGPASVDGRQVERYSATLSREFTDDLVDRVLSGFGVDSSQVELSLEEATMEIDLRPDGDLAGQRSTAVIEIDLSQVAGSDLVVTQTTRVDQTVRDIGAAITIPPPTATREITTLEELGEVLS
jgi:hypothetical protein